VESVPGLVYYRLRKWGHDTDHFVYMHQFVNRVTADYAFGIVISSKQSFVDLGNTDLVSRKTDLHACLLSIRRRWPGISNGPAIKIGENNVIKKPNKAYRDQQS
jgi:hypothetical protein